MFARSKVFIVILLSILLITASLTSFANTINVSVEVPKATTISIPDSLPDDLQSAESLDISTQSNALSTVVISSGESYIYTVL